MCVQKQTKLHSQIFQFNAACVADEAYTAGSN